jgi:hypothetical protein
VGIFASTASIRHLLRENDLEAIVTQSAALGREPRLTPTGHQGAAAAVPEVFLPKPAR